MNAGRLPHEGVVFDVTENFHEERDNLGSKEIHSSFYRKPIG